jgi:hypothetical protein
MQKAPKKKLGSGEWVTIRDFTDDDDGYTFPKYEAKFVGDVDRQYVEDEIVLLKKTSPMSEAEHMYHLPLDVFEGIAGRL